MLKLGSSLRQVVQQELRWAQLMSLPVSRLNLENQIHLTPTREGFLFM
nr:exosome complex component RRP42 isoform X2 [Ipomoea batatas]GMD47534.1 exosome complex component RRP42 isoform X2 [Ipomoea batatas]